jgi:hypothetical protein
MTALFQDLMTSLDEVEAFLSGGRSGYKVTHPKDADITHILINLDTTKPE